MCGIVGFYDRKNKLTEAQVKAYLAASLYANTVRGVDGCGILTATFEKYDISKSISKGSRVPSTFFNSIVKKPTFGLVHNRASTIGGNTVTNNHPFDCGETIGVHNGTLANGWRNMIGIKHGTDSENLYDYIDEHGLAKAVSQVAGAMSLVYWNKTTRMINFYRNEERPMVMVRLNGVLYYGSEYGIIIHALSSSGILAVGDALPAGKITQVGVHYQLDMETGKVTESEVLPSRQFNTVHTQSFSNKHYQRNYDTTGGTKIGGGSSNHISRLPAPTKKHEVGKSSTIYPVDSDIVFEPHSYNPKSKIVSGSVKWANMDSPSFTSVDDFKELDADVRLFNIEPSLGKFLVRQGETLILKVRGHNAETGIFTVSDKKNLIRPVRTVLTIAQYDEFLIKLRRHGQSNVFDQESISGASYTPKLVFKEAKFEETTGECGWCRVQEKLTFNEDADEDLCDYCSKIMSGETKKVNYHD